ncbi:questin oxidase family protein [Streptomyces sp. XD-27]|uniref:questin oxidase family protein n=1 Tax=Streptomyces sp. XD-27 TaxID=3062779 RepID=UPI0026F45C7A|nr:questin oxidase family protein [Streptomyces sp. XD-27]WKX72191.1 questin oxidase family protein [Streptomyces sp. XD-27]
MTPPQQQGQEQRQEQEQGQVRGRDRERTATGALDEALERLHSRGPERLGRLTNHAPMAVEALTAHGHSERVHRWLDLYARKLEDFPAATGVPVTNATWRSALGDPRRAGDWIGYFTRTIAERPWRDVLIEWWPRLLPGIAGGSTHPVIRVGHAVRTLLRYGETAPRRTELAHGLGYWAARHHPLPGAAAPAGSAAPGTALWSVPAVPVQEGGLPDRLAQLEALPAWTAATAALRPPTGPEDAREGLAALVAAATHRYAAQAEAEPIMLVHAVTAPNAVLRTLPALPRALWVPSLGAAWAASAAVTAAYAPGPPGERDEEYAAYAPGPPNRADGEYGEYADGEFGEHEGGGLAEAFARAVEHGDEHAIKLADSALDVARATGSPAASAASAAVTRACALITPLR